MEYLGRHPGGVVNVPDGTTSKLRRIELNPSGHPVPDERGEHGARRILKMSRDLLICVVSRAAHQRWMPAPTLPLTLAEKQEITRSCGGVEIVFSYTSSIQSASI